MKLSNVWLRIKEPIRKWEERYIMGLCINLDTGMISWVKCKVQKGELKLLEAVDGKPLSALEPGFLGKPTPVGLALTGKGVFTKFSKNKPPALQDALPGAKPSDFVSQTYENHGHYSTWLRKETLEDVLIQLKTLGVLVEKIQLDVFRVLEIPRPAMDNTGLVCGKSIDPSKPHTDHPLTWAMDGHELMNEGLVAFSTTYNAVINNHQLQWVNKEGYLSHWEESLFWKRTHLLKHKLIPGLLILLLIGGLTHRALQNPILNRKARLELIQSEIEKLSTVQEKLKELEVLTSGHRQWLQYENSFYLDQLALIRPHTIRFEKLNVHPKIRKYRNATTTFDYGVFELMGKVKDSKALNSWVQSLMTRDWIQEVEITGFHQPLEKAAEFSLKIELR